MAVRLAGVRLEAQNLAQYLNGTKQADDAYKRLTQTLQAFAQADSKATTAVRGAMQQRVAIAKAESTERIQAAKATSTQIIEQERRATATLRAELQQQAAARRQAAASQRAASGGGGSFTDKLSAGVAGGIGRSAVGLGLGFLGLQGAQQALSTALELDQLRSQALSTNTALTLLAGGGGQAAAAIRQIQAVAPGSTSALDAANSAVTILTQKLPSAAVSMKEIAQFAAIVPRISPSIKDSSDALGQLTLFSNSASFARADQLGLVAEDVKNRVKELAATFPELSDTQLKSAASVQLLIERFGPLVDSLAENVSGAQKLRTAWADLREELAKGPVGKAADEGFSDVGGFLNRNAALLGSQDRQVQIGALEHLQGNAQDQADMARNLAAAGGGGVALLFAAGAENNVKNIERTIQALEGLDKTSGPEGLKNQIVQLTDEIIHAGAPTQEHLARLQVLQAGLKATEGDLGAFAAANRTFASDQAAASADAAASRQELTDARAQANQLAKESLDLFAGGAPGAEELVKKTLELQASLAGSTTVTEEQAAALAQLTQEQKIVAALSGQVVAGVDAETIAAYQAASAYETMAASIRAVNAAQAGVNSGIVSSLSGLIGKGTINAGQAGALNTVLQDQASTQFSRLPAGLSPDQAAFAQAQIQRDTSGAFVAELLEIETSMTKEAQKQHQAAQASSKEWNNAQKDAEKAAAAQKKLVEKIEGLLSPSKVTQQQLDIAEAGGEVSLPDNFLRRFRDVSENFDEKGLRADFGEEQLQQARTALERIGVQPLEDLQGFFAQFEQAWEDKSLFSDKANLELFDKAAIEAQKTLIGKQEEGLKNIYEFMGVKIDETVAGATGGGGVPPIDQEALQARIDAALKKKIEASLMASGFLPSGTSAASIAAVVTGAGGGKGGGFQEAFSGVFGTAEILRGTFEGVTTTADILREAFGRVGESTDAYIAKQDAIPQLVWQGEGGVIETFPNWKGDEGIIPEFPGWDHWLGAEKASAGTTDMGASGTTGADTVPSLVQQSLTSPSVNTNNNTRNTTVTINTNQSTGSLISDWAILEHQAR